MSLVPLAEHVFVYGTLLRGNTNEGLLKGGRLIGRGTVHGLALFDVHPSYPGAVKAADKKVRGEVFAVDAALLAKLDRLEHNGVLYRREIMPVLLEESGKIVEAWVYLWLGDVRPQEEVPLHRQPWKG